jgi:Zn-dependent peptidase ImmA (M78 family)
MIHLDRRDPPEVHQVLLAAVDRLPTEIQQFLDLLVDVYMFGGMRAAMTLTHTGRPWIVFIDARMNPEQLGYVLVHEIAHAWLGHGGHPDQLDGDRGEKREAHEQAVAWGFPKGFSAH